jgi:uncharacterized LabA/DUF88 family protein
MIKHKEQRVGVFIDVANMYHSAKNLYGTRVNFKEVLTRAVDGRKLVRAIAYVVKAQITEEESFFTALDKQGFDVKSKDLQVFPGGMKKGDWDVGITIDMIKMSPQLDAIVLVTGDGDYLPAVQYLQFHGCQVEVMAFGKTASAKLIEAADDFVDLSVEPRKFLISSRR